MVQPSLDLLTGSMASNYWGVPRTTLDLDFVVQLPSSAVPRILQAFSGDFYLEEAAMRVAFQPPHQFNAIDTRSARCWTVFLPQGISSTYHRIAIGVTVNQ